MSPIEHLWDQIGKKFTKLNNHQPTSSSWLSSSSKAAALAALRRKKRCEAQLKQIDGTLTTIEFQIETLEAAGTNHEVFKALKIAGDALKGANQGMDVDAVHETMDDLQEQHDIANEISEAISTPAGFGADIDMDDLEAELEQLTQEDLDEQLLNVGPAPEEDLTLPSAPTSVPAAASSSKKTNFDKELEELAEWAS